MNSTSSDVIGEGSYGCVHKPKLECNQSKKSEKLNSSKYISKFMLTKEAMKEISEYTVIAAIDSKKQYYLGKPLKCKPKKNEYNVKSAEKCDIYKELGQSKTRSKKNSLSKTAKKSDKIFNKFSLLIIPDGGMDLSKLADSFSKMSSSEKTDSIKLFWKKAERLLHGIQLFEKHGIVHHDVKPHNILYDKENNDLKFIDFGLMRKISELESISKKNENYIAEYPFWTYPFEFAYLNRDKYMKIANLSIEKKREYYTDLVNKLKISSNKLTIASRIFFDYILRNSSGADRMKPIQRYFDDFMNMIYYEMTPDNYDAFLDKSIRTIDLFGVGMTLQFMLCYSEDIFDSEKIAALTECFFNMMRPSVMHRYTIQEAIEHYTDIMKSDSYKSTSVEIDSAVSEKHIKKLDKKKRFQLVKDQEDFLEKTAIKS